MQSRSEVINNMQSAIGHNSTELDRQADLRGYMFSNKVTFVQIGQWLGGITGDAAQKALSKTRISTAHYETLIQRGIPSRLLPIPLDVRTGPKPKAKPTPDEFLPQASKGKGGAHVTGR